MDWGPIVVVPMSEVPQVYLILIMLAPQLVQTELVFAPTTAENVPLGHARHDPLVPAPLTFENVPLGQGVHALKEVALSLSE